MAQLHGGEDGEIPVRLFKLRMLTVLAFVSMFGTGIACVAGGDWLLFGCGLVFCILSPFLMLKDLDRQIRKRKQAFLYGLPELANNLLLLVNAGETVQQAIVRCAESGSGRADDPLFSELSRAVRELENRRPFQEVMEAFNKRCAVREVSMLTTTVLLNYRRGGNELVSALQQLSHELWERRKALAKTWGEEASSKLVFPMVVIFLVIMAIIAAPAVMMLHS